MPAAPMSGLILPPVSTHISLPKRMPTAVSRVIAINPRPQHKQGLGAQKLVRFHGGANAQPEKQGDDIGDVVFRGVLQAIDDAAFLIKFPNITVPIKGAPLGARIDAKMVTTMGKRIFVVLDTGCWLLP